MNIFAIFILMLISSTAQAAWLQYRTDTFEVVGAFETQEDMRLTPDTAPLEVPGETVATIPWPVPSGCTAGKKIWTRVTSPGELPMLVRSGLPFFTSTSTLMTNCRQVSSWAELRHFVEQTIITVMQGFPLLDAVTTMNVVTQAVCPTGTPTACANARSKMNGINNTATLLPSPTALDSFLGQVTTLKDDAITFKQTQCSGGNNAFC